MFRHKQVITPYLNSRELLVVIVIDCTCEVGIGSLTFSLKYHAYLHELLPRALLLHSILPQPIVP